MESEPFGNINDEEVGQAIEAGELIKHYPEDKPYTSCLIYGRTHAGRPLHVVCAYDSDSDMAIVVTAYEPDPEAWVEFRERKRR